MTHEFNLEEFRDQCLLVIQALSNAVSTEEQATRTRNHVVLLEMLKAKVEECVNLLDTHIRETKADEVVTLSDAFVESKVGS
jgi:hypothetical protein